MFPTWTIPPQHAETVGARKARKALQDDESKTGKSTPSISSEGTAEVVPVAVIEAKAADTQSIKRAKKSFFGWGYMKKSRGIQEISVLPSLKTKKAPPKPPPEPAPQLSPVHPPLITSLPPENFEPQLDLPQLSSARFNPQQLRSRSPSPPPTALPTPPSSPGLSHTLRERVDLARCGLDRISSQYPLTTPGQFTAYPELVLSQNTPISLNRPPVSSDRAVFSVRSVFSNPTGYDGIVCEESYPKSRYPKKMQLEPIVRNSRSQISLADRGPKMPQTPFARALAKMENASARIIAARLGENWERLDDDESYQEVLFEKRLWALTAYQRLTQNKQLQTPAHEILSGSRLADQRRILHLHGSLADGWMLAARYPAATVYTTSSTTNFSAPTAYPAPLNHHSLFVPSLSSPMPFPDEYFDAIVSRSVSTLLHNDQWTHAFSDFKRILKSGGQVEILSIDAHPSNEGPKLSSWVDEHIVSKLEEQSMSKQPSETLLDTMEIVGLEHIRRAKVAIPEGHGASRARAHGITPPPPDMADSIKMMAYLGRHFYQDLYGQAMGDEQNREWFWSRKDIQNECERHQTKIILTIACAQKPADPAFVESYLDR